MRGVTPHARIVLGHAAEELLLHVLGPSIAEFLVAKVETVLRLPQAGHRADRQVRQAAGPMPPR
jgi:hypothetical protein